MVFSTGASGARSRRDLQYGPRPNSYPLRNGAHQRAQPVWTPPAMRVASDQSHRYLLQPLHHAHHDGPRDPLSVPPRSAWNPPWRHPTSQLMQQQRPAQPQSLEPCGRNPPHTARATGAAVHSTMGLVRCASCLARHALPTTETDVEPCTRQSTQADDHRHEAHKERDANERSLPKRR